MRRYLHALRSNLGHLQGYELINLWLAFFQLITAVSSVSLAFLAFNSQYVLQRHQLELNQKEYDYKANQEARKELMESTAGYFSYNYDHHR